MEEEPKKIYETRVLIPYFIGTFFVLSIALLKVLPFSNILPISLLLKKPNLSTKI